MLIVLQIIKRLTLQLRRENLHRVLLFLVFLILAASLAFRHFEENLGIWDALWWSVVTVTTVGYGDISPATAGGRIVGIVLMLVGIGFLGILTATIAGMFIENKLMEARGMRSTTVKRHFTICGWNPRGHDIVAELRTDEKSKDAPIVLVAQLEEKPLEDANLLFIRGEVKPDVLEKANLAMAQAAIMLSDDRLDPNVRDAKTILDTLTVKSLYPDLYVCVELMDQKNIDHCRRARADEIIVVGELSTNLLVQAVLDPGITQMISELVSNRYGQELYKVQPPPSIVGDSFYEAMCQLKKSHGILCVAVQNRRDRRLIANPDSDYRIGEDDELVVIAEKRPVLS